VGSSTASGGATTGSAQTDIIKSGLKLEVTPNFDAQDGSVFTQVKVDMSTLVGFRELSAGQNLGNLSQPQMKNLNFENVGRLNAGDTVIVGGISYDQISNNYTNFPGMEKMATGSKAQTVNRNAIYIVVRPTVVIFTPKANELNAKLQAMESQAAAASKAGEAR
jgi:type II secretory pathway component GspD/PulD (secretin)